MWTVTIDGARRYIQLGAHIDNFVIACANRQVLDALRARLLDAFECTYEGDLRHYLGCICPRLTISRMLCSPTIFGMQLLVSPQCSQTRVSIKAIVTRTLPQNFIGATAALSAA